MTMTLLPAETKLTCAENLRAALAAYESQPADADVWTKLLSARREFAAEVAAFPPGQKSGGSLDEARALLRELAKSSIQGRETVGEDLARAQEWGRGKWPGMLAAMALVPAWQWREAPTLSAVPDWLWPDYAAWWFAPPSAAHDATSFDAYVTGTSRHLDELARWLRRNPGSAAVRAASVCGTAAQINAMPRQVATLTALLMAPRTVTGAIQIPRVRVAPLGPAFGRAVFGITGPFSRSRRTTTLAHRPKLASL